MAIVDVTVAVVAVVIVAIAVVAIVIITVSLFVSDIEAMGVRCVGLDTPCKTYNGATAPMYS